MGGMMWWRVLGCDGGCACDGVRYRGVCVV